MRMCSFAFTAFALRPKLLLLDEPVNGLDFQSTEYLYQLINEYRQYGTILFSSHVLESFVLTLIGCLFWETAASVKVSQERG
jgi:ABC-2 type transport system ATP-binding protein